MTGIAVKVTGIFAQTGPEGLAVTETLTGREATTDMVITGEVAGFPVAQTALLVRMQLT